MPYGGGQAGMCDRSPTAVPICQGTLAPLTLPPSLPCCLCWLGSSRRRVPLGEDHKGEGPAASVVPVSGGFQGQSCPMAGESSRGGLSPPCKTHPWRSFALGRQLGDCCPILLPCEALPLPVPQFPHTTMLPAGDAAPYLHLPAASLGHRCHPSAPPPGPGCSAEAPRCPPPSHGPGCREPALRSLLTLIKILQHGGRKCIFSSSAAAIRLPGNGWLAGGQGLQRASAHPARGGGRRRAEPVVLVGTGLSRWYRSRASWVSPWCARRSPTGSARAPRVLGASCRGMRCAGCSELAGTDPFPAVLGSWGEPRRHLLMNLCSILRAAEPRAAAASAEAWLCWDRREVEDLGKVHVPSGEGLCRGWLFQAMGFWVARLGWSQEEQGKELYLCCL